MSIRDKGSLAKDKRIKTNKYSNKQIKVTLPIKNKQKECPPRKYLLFLII